MTLEKNVLEKDSGVYPIEDTLEGLGVEKEERRRFTKALKNTVSQEVREALKALWDEISKRFEMMEMRFKEIKERFDRHEKATRKQLNEIAYWGKFRIIPKIFLGQDSIHSQLDQVLFHLNGWPLLSHEQDVDCPVRIESVFPPLFDS